MPRLVYKIGCDPELFVQDSKGNFVSAHDLLPGNKHAPYVVDKGALQPDGTAAEFNIDPATTAGMFHENIKTVLLQLEEEVKAGALLKGIGAVHLKVQPTAKFNVAYFEKLPGEALALGCDRDWNAWTGTANEKPMTTLPMRTGGGHVHIGWTTDNEPYEDGHWDDCINAVKQLDASLFFYSMLWDGDQKRRSMYGKMGSFRPKHYGVEYRPLSNAWVADPELHDFIFKTTRRSMEMLDDYDIKFFENDEAKKLLFQVRQHPKMTFPRKKLIDFYLKTSVEWGLPELPDRYLEA